MSLKYTKNKITLTLIVALISITFCRAQTIWVVENLSDSPGVTKSLRWTIASASAGDTIKFLSSLDSGTITLMQGEIEIDKNLTITGPSHFGITIDANDASRVFNLNALTNYWPNSKLKIGITKLNLTNGFSNDSGGAIYCSIGTQLKVFNCSFTNNTVSTDGTYSIRGGAISGGHECRVTILNSSFDNNNVLSSGTLSLGIMASGGAISNDYNTSYTTINSCTFNTNYAHQDGGAIETNGNIRIGHSLFENNIADNGQGGAVYSLGAERIGIHNSNFLNGEAAIGAGLSINFSEKATISNCEFSYNDANGGAAINAYQGNDISFTNCTISNNTAVATGGIVMRGGNFNIINCTIAFNYSNWGGSGLYLSPTPTPTTITLKNSIIANNTAAISPENDISGSFISDGYNIIGDTTGAIITPTTGDFFNSDPLLFPLVDNGGQSRTHAFDFSSPAFEGGIVTGLSAYDQRGIGFDRVYGLTTDIGAYEHQMTVPPLPNSKEKTINIHLVSIYPNPAKNTFSIKGLKNPANIFINNIHGKLLMVFRNYKNTNLSIEHLNSGLYLVNIETPNSFFTKRLFKD